MRKITLLGGVLLTSFLANASAQDQDVDMRAKVAKAQQELTTMKKQKAHKAQSGEAISFKNDVQPILHDYCVSCHQPGGKGFGVSGLDMTSYDSLMRGTHFGKVVVPGNSKDSTFTKLLQGTDSGLRMPWGLKGTLDEVDIRILNNWVSQGAKNN